MAPKKYVLYNYDRAIKYPVVCVFEGIKSVFKLPDVSVASMGKAMPDSQLRLLSNWPRILFMFDRGTEEETMKLASRVTKETTSRAKAVIFRDYGYDKPGDIPPLELAGIFRKEYLGI